MRITVLGCGGAFPRAGGACSGYLVEGGGARVWLDAGNGTMSNLLRHASYRDVDALVVSHRHADHNADVLPFMYARGFDPDPLPQLTVYAPPDVGPRIMATHGTETIAMFERTFAFHHLGPPFEVKGLRFEPFRTVHPVQTWGVRVSEGGPVLAYTADTASFPELADAVRGADLLISEATYVRGMDAPPGLHMWAEEAGEAGAKAGVGRLVLVHVWGTVDPARAVEEAGARFDGALEAAAEGNVYEL